MLRGRPWGFLDTKPFCAPHFFDYSKQPSLSLHDLPRVPVSRFKQLLIWDGRGWMQDQGKTNSQEQPWGIVLFPHQRIHTAISLSYFADTETPSRWEKLKKVFCPQACRPQTSWTRGLMMLTPTYLTTNPSEECPQADYSLFEQLL